MRRCAPLLLSITLITGLGLGSVPSAGVSNKHGTTLLRSSHSDAPACDGREYLNYVDTQAGYVQSDGEKPDSSLDIIKMPSYAPIATVIGQWPVGCAKNFGHHFTTYLFVSSGPWSSERETLPLATQGPMRPECLVAVTPTADGNDYPLTCAHGRVNVAAWESYAELLPRLFTLGRQASRCQVYEAELRPALSREESLTVPEVDASYVLAHAYYDWTFDVPSTTSPTTSWESHCAATR